MVKESLSSSPVAVLEQAPGGRLLALWNSRITLLLLWLAAALTLGSILLLEHPWAQNGVAATDFHIFYQAAATIHAGKDPFAETLAGYQRVFQENVRLSSYYVYPPPFALALVPLTLVPFQAALALWTALSIVCFVLTIVLLVKLNPPRNWLHWTAIFIICCALIGLFRDEIKIGQVDILLTFFAASSFFAYARNRPVLAGVLLALACVVKPFFGVLLFYYVWKRAYRAAISCLLTGLACFGLSLAFLGWQINLEWLQVARDLSQPPYTAARVEISFQSFLLRLIASFHPAPPWNTLATWPATLGAVVLAAVVCALTLRLVHRRPAQAERLNLEVALWVVGMLLAFPIIEDIHVTALVISLVLLATSVLTLRTSRQAGRGLILLTGVTFLYFMNPLLPRWQWADAVEPVTTRLAIQMGAYLLGLLLVFGVICALLWSRQQSAKQGM